MSQASEPEVIAVPDEFAVPTGSEAPEAPEAAATASRPRRRRTGLLFGLAATLGVLGGAGTGYGIQAGRTPTPLPPLTVAQPAYPSARATAPALSVADDDMVRTDGDLTKLLLPVPKGSKPEGIQGWLSFTEYVQGFNRPANAFRNELDDGFRRAARAGWRTGDTDIQLELIQYQHATEDAAARYVSDELSFADERGGDPGGTAIPGYPSGRVYAGKKRLHDDGGSGSYYESRALASHGDIAVEVFVDGPDPISARVALDVITKQLERL